MAGDSKAQDVKNVYKKFDKDELLEVHKGSVASSNAMSELLNTIVGKCFSTMFYLNGGASVAVLAFIGTAMKEDRIQVNEIKYALTCFAIGTLMVAICTMFSYLAQFYYCEEQYIEQDNLESMLIDKMISSNGINVFTKDMIPNSEQTKCQKHGNFLRILAICSGILSVILFAGGVYFFNNSIVEDIDLANGLHVQKILDMQETHNVSK